MGWRELSITVPAYGVWIGLACALAGCASHPPLPLPETPRLVLERTILLPQVKGGFDLMAVDVDGKRLFVAGKDNNTVEVLDLEAGKLLHSIGGLHQPKGIVYLPDSHKLYVSNKDDGVVRIFDSESFGPIGSIDFKTKANNLRYDAETREIYVGYGDGAIGVISAANDSRGPDVPLASFPKQFRLEHNGKRMFVNVPVANQIAVINRKQMKLIDTWPVKEAKDNVSMELDEQDRRLFITCDPGRFVVFNTKYGKSVANIKIHPDANCISYDAMRRLIYVSCASASIEIIRQLDADHYELVSSIETPLGAMTSLFSPELDRLYLAVPQSGDQPAQVRVYRAANAKP